MANLGASSLMSGTGYVEDADYPTSGKRLFVDQAGNIINVGTGEMVYEAKKSPQLTERQRIENETHLEDMALRNMLSKSVEKEFLGGFEKNFMASARSYEEAQQFKQILDNSRSERVAVAVKTRETREAAIRAKSVRLSNAAQAAGLTGGFDEELKKISDFTSKFTKEDDGSLTEFASPTSPRDKGIEAAPERVREYNAKINRRNFLLQERNVLSKRFPGRISAPRMFEPHREEKQSALDKFFDLLFDRQLFFGSGIGTAIRDAQQRGNRQVSAPVPSSATSTGSPFPDYPDAKLVDGRWLVVRDGVVGEVTSDEGNL